MTRPQVPPILGGSAAESFTLALAALRPQRPAANLQQAVPRPGTGAAACRLPGCFLSERPRTFAKLLGPNRPLPFGVPQLVPHEPRQAPVLRAAVCHPA